MRIVYSDRRNSNPEYKHEQTFGLSVYGMGTLSVWSRTEPAQRRLAVPPKRHPRYDIFRQKRLQANNHPSYEGFPLLARFRPASLWSRRVASRSIWRARLAANGAPQGSLESSAAPMLIGITRIRGQWIQIASRIGLN